MHTWLPQLTQYAQSEYSYQTIYPNRIMMRIFFCTCYTSKLALMEKFALQIVYSHECSILWNTDSVSPAFRSIEVCFLGLQFGNLMRNQTERIFKVAIAIYVKRSSCERRSMSHDRQFLPRIQLNFEDIAEEWNQTPNSKVTTYFFRSFLLPKKSAANSVVEVPSNVGAFRISHKSLVAALSWYSRVVSHWFGV